MVSRAPEADALIARWGERDERYRRSRTTGSRRLSEDELGAVRAWRAREIEQLPPDERQRARNALIRDFPTLS